MKQDWWHSTGNRSRALEKGSFLLLFVLLWASVANSQVEATIDTAQIRIGEQITYSIKVESDTTALVLFPEGKTFGALEIIDSYPVDTTKTNARYQLLKKYGLTQFDSGQYTIPSLRVMIDDRAFDTDSIQVEVRDVPVDTTKQKMFDIKPAIEVKNPPFNWLKVLYWLVPLLLLLGVGYYFFRRKKLKEERERQLPPFEEAMVTLQKLDGSPLLKEQKYKAYYSVLTETVKRYLDREVDDRAMESTSDELIERLRLHKDAGQFDFKTDTISTLDGILKRADLVKFAKMAQEEGQAKADRAAIEHIIHDAKAALPEPSEEELQQNEAYLEMMAQRRKRKRWTIAIASGVGAIVLAAVIYGSLTGFDNLRDKVFGNEMRELSESRWYKSEYGNPAVLLNTPEVLKRKEDTVVSPQGLPSPSVFSWGSLTESLMVKVTTQALPPSNQEVDLASMLDALLASMEENGAKNMLVKQEEFETESGIKGLRAHGTFNVQVAEDKILKQKSTYELLLFAQEGGLQSVLVVYQDDGDYAEGVKNRIINSVELRLTNQGEKSS